jgi:hypothetical protein
MENLLTQIKSEENKKIILEKKNENFLKLIKFLISNYAEKNLNTFNYKNYLELALIYFNDNIQSNERKKFMETIFKFIQPTGNYLEGLEFFSEICKNLTDVTTFFDEMAYAILFAYQIKLFDPIKNILNYHFLKLDNNNNNNNDNFNYNSMKYFCMYYFYQGIFFLRERKFERASLAFMTCVNTPIGDWITKIYNIFQIESLKRLIFLRIICNNNHDINVIINNLLAKNIKILGSNLFEIYFNFYDIEDKVN